MDSYPKRFPYHHLQLINWCRCWNFQIYGTSIISFPCTLWSSSIYFNVRLRCFQDRLGSFFPTDKTYMYVLISIAKFLHQLATFLFPNAVITYLAKIRYNLRQVMFPEEFLRRPSTTLKLKMTKVCSIYQLLTKIEM